jgi:WhiB family transcriptional regulator, redox-sensing transcriptional regulator
MAVIGTWPFLAAGTELACGTNPDLFFAESPQDVARAKELCAGCPVRAGCLAGALQRGEPWGVWGGQLLLRGAIVPTKRARGRPRKSEVAA